MRQVIRNILCIITLVTGLSMSACGGSAGQGTSGGSVGTIINPVAKPSSLTLSFQTVEESSSADCTTRGENEKPVCAFTPGNYQAGVLKMWLVDCQKDGSSVACDKNANAETESHLIYDDGMTNLSFTSTESEFTGTLESIEQPTNFSMLQMEVTYIQQNFPAEGTAEASKVAAELRGVAYRLCTTSEKIHSEDMNTYCGHQEAHLGDLLVDLDKNGQFGFLDTADMAELNSRPELYDFESAETAKRFSESSDFTSVSSNGHLILNGRQDINSELQVYSTDSVENLRISFDNTDSAHFADKSGDGIYNPTEDGTLYPSLPVMTSEAE